MTLLALERPLRLALRYLLIGLIGGLLALMTTQIALRYGFNASLLWAEEVCRYLLIWIAFLAVVLAFERGEIAALGFLGALLPRRPALALAMFCTLLSIGLSLLLVWYGWRFAQMAGGAAIPALGFILRDIFGAAAPPTPGTFWVYAALPVGMGLLALRLIADLVLCFRTIAAGGTVADIIGDRTGGSHQ
ncbi:TRAP-type C4-dicarboxylate transport system, small permease component [Paracoccus alcaliphilus]|uniref:TRAP transporter small permease protein n=1 Tax=Paracoccus alcaliphilus TaxID=34002 RepID=A0A1H8KGE8_9RHOB|nr:TRAP transporter small permease subunit [Paracoccus alcaliphilus]WCR18922.1 TRAP transporter small permease subunit [Paracoccus alcaliphilus]SEN92039.1 TRAP-type C4-dicarboxylate transport system, small permease component [Paracoccus alcaliphilus]